MVRANVLAAQLSHAAESSAGLARLADRADDSVRLAGALRSLFELCTSGLDPVLRDTVAEYEKQLVRLAERATINEQNAYFDSVQELKRRRGRITPRFFAWLEDALARLGQPAAPMASGEKTKPPLTLSLTDGVQLDEPAVLADIATRVESRMREPLYALGQRFAVLAGSARIPSDVLPLGPRCLTAALCHAGAELDVPLEHRLVLYRCFERVAMLPIGAFYAALNAQLVDLGILPSLHSVPTALESTTRRPVVLRERRVKAAAPAMPQPAPAAVPVATTQASGAAFAELRELLGACRRAERYRVSAAELQGLLAAMQSRHAAEGDGIGVLGGDRIRDELFAALGERAAAARVAQLEEEDSDTIDLVAMLFESLVRQARGDGMVPWLLSRLQIPMLRLALRDKSFFAPAGHVARRLLTEAIELGRVWVDEIDVERDPALVEELQRIAQKVAYEYQDDPVVFVQALEELAAPAQRLAQRAVRAARRQIDAAIGHEKLDRARIAAAAAIADRLAAGAPSEFVGMLLQRGWCDVLAMTLLREGEQSATYARRLRVAEALVAGVADDETRDDLAAGLAQIGLHDHDVHAIGRTLFGGHDADPVSQTELAIKLKLKPRLGGEAAPGPSIAAPEPVPLSAVEQAAFDRLHTVPHGTWFEFARGETGEWVRRKLAWYSTRTSRCLFLDARGVPCESPSLRELARALAAGTVRNVAAGESAFVDRVWLSIVEMLKTFSGGQAPCIVAVSLPRPAPRAQAACGRGDAAAAARTLLLVDDEVNVQRALMRVLRNDGYRILTATSATEAMEILREQPVQVIVSDQRMPGLTGTEFLTKVKVTHPHTVRLLLSGFSDAAAVTEAINRGAIYKFLTKPWDDADFRHQVSEAFRACEAR